jgi:glutaredoxin
MLRFKARLALTCQSLVLCSVAFGCRTSVDEDAGRGNAENAVVDSKPVSDALPPLVLRDDTKDLLLTWIDQAGDFHVVERPELVPTEGRAQVRVVMTKNPEGTGRLVYVADLNRKAPDGSYHVGTMTRAAWNELGAERRKVRLEELIKKREELAAAPMPTGPIAAGKTEAIIYGADWCKPCHQAEDYLKSLGVNVTKKDIDRSPSARAEMNHKLDRAGKAGASIPVIDVMGQLFVGFNRGVLRRAVEQGQKRKTL